MNSLISELNERGLLQDVANGEALESQLKQGAITFYCGFDPTAESLHVGSMLPLIIMRRLQKRGHKPIVLLGSATGMIGDPSGKSEERNLLNEEQVMHNALGIERQAALFLSNAGDNTYEVVKNHDWLSKFGFIEFLREVGKLFSVNMMLAKDSVRGRLENRDQGISYTEFSYMLLQAYDFLHLFQTKNCVLQVGGSDQWGNITAGIDLIRRRLEKQAYGLTFPLLTTSSGTKFGKTEQGTVWLDSKRTSPYRFYQFWFNTPDQDVLRYLRLFTELDSSELSRLETSLQNNPDVREAQKALARELTSLVHGSSETAKAENAAAVLFGGSIEGLDSSTLISIFEDVPSSKFGAGKFSTNVSLVDLLVETGLANSKGAARRAVEGGGVYVNNERASDLKLELTKSSLIDDKVLILRSGKRNYHLVVVEE